LKITPVTFRTADKYFNNTRQIAVSTSDTLHTSRYRL